ncbi:MAG TPA: type II toxin-antitoxin system HicA family toxin [Bacillota bacterium]|nr:type II toxin-antitoxin system HicA family toxin [Bacillota bacterium]
MNKKKTLEFMRESKLFSEFSTEECVLMEKILKPYEKSFERKPGKVTVPNHSGDLPTGTLHSIKEQAGLK